jgi:hypothetical protein
MIDEIKYDYYSISLPHIIEKSDSETGIVWESTQKNIITGVYQGRVNQPNISFIHPKTGLINYQAVEIFISKGQSLYPQETTHDAELIILHRPTTNAPKLYTCFLLKHNSQVNSTEIDEIIKYVRTPSIMYNQDLNLCMNNYIKDGESPKLDIYEKYGKDRSPCFIVVFTNIIHISTNCSETKKITPIFENFQEGATVDESSNYLECEYLPGGVDTKDVQVYEIPIGSQVYTDGTSSDWVSLVAKNAVVFMAASIAFFGFPLVYNFFKKKLTSAYPTMTETRWSDIYILSSIGSIYNLLLTIIFFINIIILILVGLSTMSNSLVLSGLIILFSYGFGYMGLMFLNRDKQNPPIITPI